MEKQKILLFVSICLLFISCSTNIDKDNSSSDHLTEVLIKNNISIENSDKYIKHYAELSTDKEKEDYIKQIDDSFHNNKTETTSNNSNQIEDNFIKKKREQF